MTYFFKCITNVYIHYQQYTKQIMHVLLQNQKRLNVLYKDLRNYPNNFYLSKRFLKRSYKILFGQLGVQKQVMALKFLKGQKITTRNQRNLLVVSEKSHNNNFQFLVKKIKSTQNIYYVYFQTVFHEILKISKIHQNINSTFLSSPLSTLCRGGQRAPYVTPQGCYCQQYINKNLINLYQIYLCEYLQKQIKNTLLNLVVDNCTYPLPFGNG
eukprot:TRINITY_DN5269_c1_g1_i1.p6 TRINITY_DN5269_c1_g1~~TRINITY_DN5269_c1_g1_i1.p6  ORF type:complete len:212 (+),score=-10.65 TRINITY_DN5269_c1_g1_i1:2142-2777(+)